MSTAELMPQLQPDQTRDSAHSAGLLEEYYILLDSARLHEGHKRVARLAEAAVDTTVAIPEQASPVKYEEKDINYCKLYLAGRSDQPIGSVGRNLPDPIIRKFFDICDSAQ